MISAEEDDHALAAQLARAAGQILLATRDTQVFGGQELKNAGDALSQEFLARALRVARPDDAVLSEEAKDDAVRLDAERVWVIDPLDGTREYSEGRHDWAVHVALVQAGVPTAAAVALPGIDTVLDTGAPPQAPRGETDVIRIAVSRTRPPAEAEHLGRELGAELVPMGSAGFKAAAVIRGEVDAYVHSGGQYEWDSAAPIGVALATGLHASRIDGSPLVYNRPDPLLPDLLVCRADLADRLLSAIAATAPTT